MTVTNFGANMMRPMPFTGYPFQGKIIFWQNICLLSRQFIKCLDNRENIRKNLFDQCRKTRAKSLVFHYICVKKLDTSDTEIDVIQKVDFHIFFGIRFTLPKKKTVNQFL